MLSASLQGNGWTSPPLLVATSRRQRKRGLSPIAHGRGCLIRTHSVHTIGMREWLWLVPLHSSGRVLGRELVGPWRLFIYPEASWIMELPAETSPPPVGLLPVLVLRPEAVPEPLAGDGIRAHNKDHFGAGLGDESV